VIGGRRRGVEGYRAVECSLFSCRAAPIKKKILHIREFITDSSLSGSAETKRNYICRTYIIQFKT
jgi:hypothetical protein